MAIEKYGMSVKKGEEKKIFNILDTNWNGVIDYDEFIVGMIDV